MLRETYSCSDLIKSLFSRMDDTKSECKKSKDFMEQVKNHLKLRSLKSPNLKRENVSKMILLRNKSTLSLVSITASSQWRLSMDSQLEPMEDQLCLHR